MALKLKRETVVDVLAGVAKKAAPEMKFYLMVLERGSDGIGIGFACATNLNEKQQAWLIEQLQKRPAVPLPAPEPKPEPIAMLVQTPEGTARIIPI